MAVVDIAGDTMKRRPANSLTRRRKCNVKISKQVAVKDIARSMAQRGRRRTANSSLTRRLMRNVTSNHWGDVMDIAGHIMTRRPANSSLTKIIMYNVKRSKQEIVRDIAENIIQDLQIHEQRE